MPPSLQALVGGKGVAGVDAPPATAAELAPAPFTPPGVVYRVRFDGGAVLTVRCDPSAPPPSAPPAGAAVNAVRQHGTALTLELAGGRGALTFRLAEASGCVMLRNDAGRMVYAD